eukprot:TRINITY_DN18846_c0_g1_i1.p1 TRINITY_DN18846_c0_g1~~TRINITY_DN18846_c0_g1_i1.p1  ORF type:complete len:145 (-),score=25.70 TRINITY_DN18846_c0_g1_i1:365-799(-)
MAMRAMIRNCCRMIRGRRGVRGSRVEPVSEFKFDEILPGDPESRERGGQLKLIQEANEAKCATSAHDSRDLTMPHALPLTHTPADPERHLVLEEIDAVARDEIMLPQETMIYIPDPQEYLDPEDLDALLFGRFDDDEVGALDLT